MDRRRMFFDKLKERGLFVRDYDPLCFERLPMVADTLHRELAKLDTKSIKGWEDISLFDLVNDWVSVSHGLRPL